MNAWAERAKGHFSQMPQKRTDETDETPLSSVLSVPSQHLCEKTEGAKGTFVGFVSSHLGHSEKTALPAASPNWAPPAQPDPGLPRLLGAAMALCNHTGASDKARADWHADIAATPVEQRGELAAYLQSQLPAPSLKAMPSLPPMAGVNQPKPMPKFDQAQAWRKADREFQAHYWQCPECKAGGRTRGPLCPTGAELHQQYEQAAMATEGASQ
jgi:hypothetical protein